MKKQSYFWRGIFYSIGLVMLTCGITLNAKTQLGVSPINPHPQLSFRPLGLRIGTSGDFALPALCW